LISSASTCASLFSCLLHLLRQHPQRTPLIGTAIKCGGKFVEDLQRSTGAWRGLWPRHEERLRGTVRRVQRGTRLLNALCADGKERRAVAITKKVPGVKRAIEAFMLNMRALFHEMGCAEGIRIAQLRNKDLHGNEVPSQAYDDDNDAGGYYDADADADVDADADGGEQQHPQPPPPQPKKRGRKPKAAAAAEGSQPGAAAAAGVGGGIDGDAEADGGKAPKRKKPRGARAAAAATAGEADGGEGEDAAAAP
ncbi:hypothetical protein Agub_g10952, partial [Astrephomene gubernaculifera]